MSRLLDLLFPPRCPWCDQVVGRVGCDTCEKLLAEIALYALPVDHASEGRSCEHLDEVYAGWRYEGLVQTAIRRYKFGEGQHAGKALGGQLAKHCRRCGLAEAYDIVLPVPKTKAELKNKAFDPVLPLAAAVAEALNLPLDTASLAKVKETKRQAELGRQERQSNIKDAFAATANVQGLRVLLIDDIITTGSTLEECARVLKQEGAVLCGAACLASTAYEAFEQNFLPEFG